MNYAARISDGVVVEVVALPAEVALAEAFHLDAGFIAADETAVVGMTYANGAFGPPLPPPAPPVPVSISDRQFFQQLAIEGTITQADSLAAVKTGVLPAPLAAIIADIEDPEERFAAEMLLSGATIFERGHPLTDRIAAARGKTPGQTDDFFRAAGAL